ncbi:MAG: hypothetical protein ACRCYU_18265 [Nocardioides sp.]
MTITTPTTDTTSADAVEVSRLEALLPVLTLHTRRAGPIKEIDCWEHDCEHPEGQCPVVTDAACAHCADMGDPGVSENNYISAEAFWPCETLRRIEATWGEPIEHITTRAHALHPDNNSDKDSNGGR